MQMGLRIIQTVPCWVCGATDGHYDDCELMAMDKLREHIVKLPCPKCMTGKVGVNDVDYYECRDCHTQFSTSELVDCQKPEEAMLVDIKHDCIISVLVLQHKGEGKFPIDQAHEELRKRLDKRRRTFRRKRENK